MFGNCTRCGKALDEVGFHSWCRACRRERTRPAVRLVCAVCSAPVGRECDVMEFPIPGSVNLEAEGLCVGCVGWLLKVMDEVYRSEFPEEEGLEPEPEVDDGPRYCPECETPNQFGEVCLECVREREYSEDAGEPYEPLRLRRVDSCQEERRSRGLTAL